MHFGEDIANSPKVLVLRRGCRCIAFVRKSSDILYDGREPLIVGKPPTDAVIVAEKFGHASAHIDGGYVPMRVTTVWHGLAFDLFQ
jgi:hypothetical protein